MLAFNALAGLTTQDRKTCLTVGRKPFTQVGCHAGVGLCAPCPVVGGGEVEDFRKAVRQTVVFHGTEVRDIGKWIHGAGNLRGSGVVLAEEPIHGSFPEILVRQEQARRKQVVYCLLVGTGVWWLSGRVGQPDDEHGQLIVGDDRSVPAGQAFLNGFEQVEGQRGVHGYLFTRSVMVAWPVCQVLCVIQREGLRVQGAEVPGMTGTGHFTDCPGNVGRVRYISPVASRQTPQPTTLRLPTGRPVPWGHCPAGRGCPVHWRA